MHIIFNFCHILQKEPPKSDTQKLTFSQVENQIDASGCQHVEFQSSIVHLQINERLHLLLLMIHQNGEMCQLAM